MKYFLYFICYAFLVFSTSDFFDHQVFEWLIHYQQIYCKYSIHFDGGLRDVSMLLQADFCFFTVCVIIVVLKLGAYLYQKQILQSLNKDIFLFLNTNKKFLIIFTSLFLIILYVLDISAYSIMHGQLFYIDDFSDMKRIGFSEFILTLFATKTLFFVSFFIPIYWLILSVLQLIYWVIDKLFLFND